MTGGGYLLGACDIGKEVPLDWSTLVFENLPPLVCPPLSPRNERVGSGCLPFTRDQLPTGTGLSYIWSAMREFWSW